MNGLIVVMFICFYPESGVNSETIEINQTVSISTDSVCNTTLECKHKDIFAPQHYEWYRVKHKYHMIHDNDKYSGSNEQTLTILNTDKNDAGGYRCKYGVFEFFIGWWVTKNWGPLYSVSVQDNSVWSCWEAWGECSVTCETGTRRRIRHSKSNFSTPATQTDVSSCELHYNCPEDGMWSEWGYWDDCSVTCGSDGTQTRFRLCNNPFPSIHGKDCEGLDSESRNCTTLICPVNGMWSDWEGWSQCSVTCGGEGIQSRNRMCNNPKPAGNGKDCTGSRTEHRSCTSTVCPVNGMWSRWEDWAQCSATCGDGMQTRNRQCNNPKPVGNGKDCDGIDSEQKSCRKPECPVNGMWSDWEGWSQCSVTCGGEGIQSRNRMCNNPLPSGNGKDCVGSDTEQKSCKSPVCPVNGNWSDWGEWSNCSVLCGSVGTQSRTRLCNNPFPSWTGNDCDGDHEDVRTCQPPVCPAPDSAFAIIVPVGGGSTTVIVVIFIVLGVILFIRRRKRKKAKSGIEIRITDSGIEIERAGELIGEEHTNGNANTINRNRDTYLVPVHSNVENISNDGNSDSYFVPVHSNDEERINEEHDNVYLDLDRTNGEHSGIYLQPVHSTEEDGTIDANTETNIEKRSNDGSCHVYLDLDRTNGVDTDTYLQPVHSAEENRLNDANSTFVQPVQSNIEKCSNDEYCKGERISDVHSDRDLKPVLSTVEDKSDQNAEHLDFEDKHHSNSDDCNEY